MLKRNEWLLDQLSQGLLDSVNFRPSLIIHTVNPYKNANFNNFTIIK